MKLRLVVPLAGAVLVLFFAPMTAAALDSQQGRALMQHDANETAQSTTDISLGETGQDAAYGGVADSRSQAGSRQGRSCEANPQCRIYFGQ
ncbi:hypothetical protein DLM46_08200 [Paraburkholderia lacunae]|uniref:DUF4148 domain-containing protein n=2 Tax=Paraburkholderia lacunae TaxID=2211104 RepID=A0A370ND00_9BURK|nr:hypothetical protein [Paraburkholderia lacunae]RDK03491.1 hypothetical protein DLM46_08200 [Paraburkholderia lacunae]